MCKSRADNYADNGVYGLNHLGLRIPQGASFKSRAGFLYPRMCQASAKPKQPTWFIEHGSNELLSHGFGS